MAQSDNGSVSMSKDPLTFWYADEWSPPRAGATPEEVDQAEAHIGRKLPDELRALLLVEDGGVSNYEAFEDGDRYFPVLPFFCAGSTQRADTLAHAFDMRVYYPEIPTEIIVFAAAAHSWLGLDYGSGRKDPVVVFQLNEDSEIEFVADTFAAFLAGLVESSKAIR